MRKVFGANVDLLGDFDWFNDGKELFGSVTHALGEKKANRWGLFDMHGNVWEWCQDLYKRYPGCEEPDLNESRRVCRGGRWANGDTVCRVACRYYLPPDQGVGGEGIGLRLATD